MKTSVQAHRIWGFLLAFLLLIGRGAGAQVHMLPTVSGIVHYLDKYSMADKIFTYGWWTIEKPHFAVFELDAKYVRFEGWIGVRDDDNSRGQKYRIALDGVTMMSGKVSHGDRPVHVDLDLIGVHALRIELDDRATIGNPLLYKQAALPSTVTVLISPPDKEKVTGGAVALHWQQVRGATGYGVEVVSTKLNKAESGNPPRIWAVNVQDGSNHCSFDLTDAPNGEYHWSVIAFSKTGLMGKFSKDRIFYVAR